MSEEAVKKAKVEMVAHETPERDDRLDLVTITYGQKAEDYKQEELPKQQAVDRLYTYYSRTKMKMVPKNDMNGKAVNDATIYVKLKRVDWGTGELLTVYKDLPLWIVVDRMMNHGYQIELVTKKEHDEYMKAKQKPEDELSARLVEERRAAEGGM